ncbi:MAG: hypothetical protein IH597_12740 [Bacteroidales bacterium]|nr:hypothetical protein [Bacteroidales bacterium]
MKSLGLILALIFAGCILSKAQDYNTGIGLRGGWFNGITVKHFIDDNKAIEAIASTRWGGYDFTALVEIHKPAFDVAWLYWYFGVGGHIGFWDGSRVKWSTADKPYKVLGVDAIFGMEYVFNDVPINLSLDWKPAFNLVGITGFWGDGGAFSIRYIF